MYSLSIDKPTAACQCVAILASVVVSVCGCSQGTPLAVLDLPQTADTPSLHGEVAVMLPYDVRPSVEHEGKAPDIEYIIILPGVGVDATRGNFITSDGDFALPYSNKEASSRFGSEPVIAASIGEDFVTCLTNAKVFDRVSRLRPTKEEGKTWRLPPLSACPAEATLAVDDCLTKVCASEREEWTLQWRAMKAPLPPCSSPWLLRSRIQHLYCGVHQHPFNLTKSRKNMQSTRTNITNFTPTANVVLDCELYRMQPQPLLIWNRTVTGTATGDPNDVTTITTQAAEALNQAMQQFTESLSQDIPRIEAYLERTKQDSRQ